MGWEESEEYDVVDKNGMTVHERIQVLMIAKSIVESMTVNMNMVDVSIMYRELIKLLCEENVND